MVLQRTGYWLSKVFLLAINEKDMLRNVFGLSDFLCKSLLKPSAWKRSWQRQHKEYVENWGQAWHITRASQRYCKDNKKTKKTNEDKPRTRRGQEKDSQRAAPTESTILPKLLHFLILLTRQQSVSLLFSVVRMHMTKQNDPLAKPGQLAGGWAWLL